MILNILPTMFTKKHLKLMSGNCFWGSTSPKKKKKKEKKKIVPHQFELVLGNLQELQSS